MNDATLPGPRSFFVPLLLLALAMLGQTLNTTFDINRLQDSLNAQRAAQEQTIVEAQKLRTQLESIAGETALLANNGNDNAIRLRDYLEKQGVKLRPPGAS